MEFQPEFLEVDRSTWCDYQSPIFHRRISVEEQFASDSMVEMRYQAGMNNQSEFSVGIDELRSRNTAARESQLAGERRFQENHLASLRKLQEDYSELKEMLTEVMRRRGISLVLEEEREETQIYGDTSRASVLVESSSSKNVLTFPDMYDDPVESVMKIKHSINSSFADDMDFIKREKLLVLNPNSESALKNDRNGNDSYDEDSAFIIKSDVDDDRRKLHIETNISSVLMGTESLCTVEGIHVLVDSDKLDTYTESGIEDVPVKSYDPGICEALVMDLPSFSRESAVDWVRKTEELFNLNSVPVSQRLALVQPCWEDPSVIGWYKQHTKCSDYVDWQEFCDMVIYRFGSIEEGDELEMRREAELAMRREAEALNARKEEIQGCSGIAAMVDEGEELKRPVYDDFDEEFHGGSARVGLEVANIDSVRNDDEPVMTFESGRFPYSNGGAYPRMCYDPGIKIEEGVCLNHRLYEKEFATATRKGNGVNAAAESSVWNLLAAMMLPTHDVERKLGVKLHFKWGRGFTSDMESLAEGFRKNTLVEQVDQSVVNGGAGKFVPAAKVSFGHVVYGAEEYFRMRELICGVYLDDEDEFKYFRANDPVHEVYEQQRYADLDFELQESVDFAQQKIGDYCTQLQNVQISWDKLATIFRGGTRRRTGGWFGNLGASFLNKGFLSVNKSFWLRPRSVHTKFWKISSVWKQVWASLIRLRGMLFSHEPVFGSVRRLRPFSSTITEVWALKLYIFKCLILCASGNGDCEGKGVCGAEIFAINGLEFGARMSNLEDKSLCAATLADTYVLSWPALRCFAKQNCQTRTWLIAWKCSQDDKNSRCLVLRKKCLQDDKNSRCLALGKNKALEKCRLLHHANQKVFKVKSGANASCVEDLMLEDKHYFSRRECCDSIKFQGHFGNYSTSQGVG